MHPFCWIFSTTTLPRLPLPSVTVGRIPLFLAKNICGHSRQLFFLQHWLSFLSCVKTQFAVSSVTMLPQTETQREKITERIRNSSAGQTMNCNVACTTKSSINLFKAKKGLSFTNNMSSINLWRSPGLTYTLQCNVTAYCTTAQITALLDQLSHFVAYL